MNLHINDFQHSYIDYMLFWLAHSEKEGTPLPLNICQAIIVKDNQTTTTKGVHSTNDVELHVQILTCARETEKGSGK
jgi:hypothetical protein